MHRTDKKRFLMKISRIFWQLVTIQLHYFDLVWICCTTSSWSCAAVDELSTNTARRFLYKFEFWPRCNWDTW